jgi:hypothetical protein
MPTGAPSCACTGLNKCMLLLLLLLLLLLRLLCLLLQRAAWSLATRCGGWQWTSW